MERACGQPYAELLASKIFTPLRLASTTGTGDICSTASDLTRFITAVHSGSLLTSGSRRALSTVHTPAAGDRDARPRPWY
jgi:CubicO group peptidase (beta-lactamase class C family)